MQKNRDILPTYLTIFALSASAVACSGNLDYTDPATIPRYLIKVSATGFDQKFSDKVDLVKNGDEVLSISENGTYMFRSKLKESEDYKLEIIDKPVFQNCFISNAQGNAQGDDVEVNLQCSDKTWTYPESLDEDFINPRGSGGHYKIAMNDFGEAIIVWIQVNAGFSQVFMSEYRNGQWHHPIGINDYISIPGSIAEFPDAAISNSGEAIVVWRQYNSSPCYNDPQSGGCHQTFMSFYSNGTWTHPADLSDTISPNLTEAGPAKVRMNYSGDAIIIWRQDREDYSTRTVASYRRNGTWTHPSPEGSLFEDTIMGPSPEFDIDADGNMIVVSKYNNRVYKSEYRSGQWIHPQGENDSISPSGTSAGQPKLAVDNQGNAIIAWIQPNQAGHNAIYKAQYRNGIWTIPENLSSSFTVLQGPCLNLDVSASDSGKALLAWTTIDAYSGHDFRLFVSEYDGDAWHLPIDHDQFINPATHSGENIKLGMDNIGNGILVWEQISGDGYMEIFKSQYIEGIWYHPADGFDNISPDGSNAYSPTVGMDIGGNAIVIWQQVNKMADYQIFMAEFR